MIDRNNPNNWPDKVAINSLDELPPFMRDPIMADAKVFAEKSGGQHSEWLCQCLALYKYQVEGAHERLDEMKGAIEQLVRANNSMHDFVKGMNPGESPQDSDDWWKGDRN